MVNRLSELLHVQVQHIKVSITLGNGHFIVIFLNYTFVTILQRLAFNSLPLELEVQNLLVDLG